MQSHAVHMYQQQQNGYRDANGVSATGGPVYFGGVPAERRSIEETALVMDLLAATGTQQQDVMMNFQQQQQHPLLAHGIAMHGKQEIGGFNTNELNAPEYSSDDFRMFHFKVTRCSKRFVHDWRSCPFAHPTENARRRDPRQIKYLPVPCPDYKRGICLRGDACPYSHGVYECWLHPAKYRTQLCKEGPHCSRPVCFFAHTVADLRQPTHVFQEEDIVPQNNPDILVNGGQGKGHNEQQFEEDMNNMHTCRHSEFSSDHSDHNNEDSSTQSGDDEKKGQNDDRRRDTAGSMEVPSTPPAPTGERAAAMATTGETSLLGIKSPEGKPEGKSASVDLHGQGSTIDASFPARNSIDSSLTWAHGFSASAAAAQALVGIPVNEQPLISNQGPRMSNAVARKLGLAPSRTSSSSTAGILSPQRRSFDTAVYPNARRSLDGMLDGPDLNGYGVFSASYPERPVHAFHRMQGTMNATNVHEVASHDASLSSFGNQTWVDPVPDGEPDFSSLVSSMKSLGLPQNGSMSQQETGIGFESFGKLQTAAGHLQYGNSSQGFNKLL